MPYKDLDVRRAKAKEYNRRWRERNPNWLPEYNAARRKEYAENPEYRKAVKDASIHRIPEVYRAYNRVAYALKKGTLVRPSACEECGKEAFVEAAHENYHEHLAIRWLCRPCHRRWDGNDSKIAAMNGRSWEYVHYRKVPITSYQDICDKRKEGQTITALAKENNCSRALIRTILDKHGVD